MRSFRWGGNGWSSRGNEGDQHHLLPVSPVGAAYCTRHLLPDLPVEGISHRAPFASFGPCALGMGSGRLLVPLGATHHPGRPRLPPRVAFICTRCLSSRRAALLGLGLGGWQRRLFVSFGASHHPRGSRLPACVTLICTGRLSSCRTAFLGLGLGRGQRLLLVPFCASHHPCWPCLPACVTLVCTGRLSGRRHPGSSSTLRVPGISRKLYGPALLALRPTLGHPENRRGRLRSRRDLHGLGDPGVVPAAGQWPGAEVLLVLGLALEGRVGRLVLAARPAAGLGPLHLPGTIVLSHHRVRGA